MDTETHAPVAVEKWVDAFKAGVAEGDHVQGRTALRAGVQFAGLRAEHRQFTRNAAGVGADVRAEAHR